MRTEELGPFFQYFAAFLYYVFWLLFWGQLAFAAFLFSIQSTLETIVLRRARNDRPLFFSRLGFVLFGVMFFLFSTEHLFGHRVSILPITYWNMALSEKTAGRLKQAVAYFGKAESLGEEAPKFFLDYAESLHDLGMDRQALVEACKCPDMPEKKGLMLGKIYYSLKEYKLAEDVLKETHGKHPENIFIDAWLGETYAKSGKNEEAAQMFSLILGSPGVTNAFKDKIRSRIQELEGGK